MDTDAFDTMPTSKCLRGGQMTQISHTKTMGSAENRSRGNIAVKPVSPVARGGHCQRGWLAAVRKAKSHTCNQNVYMYNIAFSNSVGMASLDRVP